MNDIRHCHECGKLDGIVIWNNRVLCNECYDILTKPIQDIIDSNREV